MNTFNIINNFFKSKIFLPVLLVLTGILCGLLQSTLDIPLLAFVSFAPMMYALQKAQGKKEFIFSFGEFFLPYYFTQTIFLAHANKAAPFPHFVAVILLFLGSLALTFLLSLETLIPVYTIRWLKRNPLTDMAFIAALITMGDFISQHIPFLSFPWSAAALSLTGMPRMIQGAGIFGTAFVSFFLLLCNGLIAQLFTARKKVQTGIILSVILGANFAYGCFNVNKWEKPKGENTIKVMCVQDDAEGDKKTEMKPLDAAYSYLDIINRNYTDDISLIILPETPLLESYNPYNKEFALLRRFAEEHKCVMISGCFLEDGKTFNSQYAILPDGSISQFYCKQVLVPFGEYNPFAVFTGESTTSPGTDKEKIKPLDCGEYSVGCAICIESIFPDISKKHVKNGSNIICVSTNDSWFGNSGGRVQHFRHCILRSVENSRYLVRAGNCGISAIISPTGKILAQNSTKEKGVATAEIQSVSQKSFYTKTGELYIVFPTLLMAAAVIRRYKSFRGELKEKKKKKIKS